MQSIRALCGVGCAMVLMMSACGPAAQNIPVPPSSGALELPLRSPPLPPVPSCTKQTNGETRCGACW